MGLQDFWDNIRTPGFISTSIDEFADIWKDTKKEFLSLREEGEEVFIDGFREMVIKENSGYKNSVQKRDEAKLLISEIRSQLLAARGFTEGDSRYLIGNIGQSLKNTLTALVDLDRNKINGIISTLQTQYKYLPILNLKELLAFSDHTTELLKLPEAPEYQQPYSESDASFLDAGLRKLRVVAADKYLAEAKGYQQALKVEVFRQQEFGILFNHSAIDGETVRLLETYERKLSIENMALKFLAENQEEPTQDDWLKVRAALILAAGICSITSLALATADKGSRGTLTADLMADLASGLNEVANRDKGSSDINSLAYAVAANFGGMFQTKE